MDFDQNLSKIQGALVSFPNIDSDDGKIKILEEIFSNAKETEKPKMVFFLILNTDLGISDKIKDDDNIGLIIDICPQLELNFLTILILNLKLTHCLCDIVSNCPIELSVKLLEALYFKLDNFEPDIYGLSRVLWGTTEKLYKVSKGSHSDSYCFSALNKIVLKYLNFFVEKIDKIGELRRNLLILNFWLKKFLNYIKLIEEDCEILSDNPIFRIVYERDENENENEEASSFEFSKHVHHMCDIIFGKFDEILNGCNDLKGDAPLLESISENARQLQGKISNHPSGYSLERIIRKLEAESDAGMDINVLVSKMKNDKLAGNLFKTIVNYPNVFKNEDAIICISNHLNLADSDDLKTIIELIQEQSEVSKLLQNLYFSSMGKLSLDDQLSYLNKYFQSNSCLLNDENSAIDLELTEKFNKISDNVSDSVTMSCLIVFCIKSPLKTIMKICEEALSNVKQFPCWVDRLVMLKSACLSGHYILEGDCQSVNCISYAAYSLINKDILYEREKNLLIRLIADLCRSKILDGRFVETLIANILLKEIGNAKSNKVVLVLDLLRAFTKSKSILHDKYVMTAFVSQILSHTSWDCKSFSVQLAKTREIVIGIVNDLVRNLHPTEGPEIRWLYQKLMKSSEINILYFCDLWFSLNSNLITSNELHIQLLILLHTKCKTESIANGIIKKFESKNFQKFENHVNGALIKILPILIVKEWMSLFTNLKLIIKSLLKGNYTSNEISLKVFELFKNSMYIMALDMSRNGDTISCFEFCTRNFGRVIRQNLLSDESLSCSGCRELLIGLLFLLNGIRNVECRKLNSLILSPIILDLANRTERSETQSSNAEIGKLETWFKTSFI